MTPPNHDLTDEELENWRDEEVLRYLYEDLYLSAPQIGELVGFCARSVRRQMDKHGIERRTGGSEAYTMQKIRALRASADQEEAAR